MRKSLILGALIFSVASIIFSGCSDEDKSKFELSNTVDKTYLLDKQKGDVFYIDNKTMYKVVTETETKNKIGEILNLDRAFEYTKMYIKAKTYNDSIYYKVDLQYLPLVIEVPDEKNPSVKVKKDASIVDFKEWKKIITNSDKNYSITLVFQDEDNFTVITKDILLSNISVNNDNGVTYEGSFVIDKSLATKINKLSYYYYFPELQHPKN